MFLAIKTVKSILTNFVDHYRQTLRVCGTASLCEISGAEDEGHVFFFEVFGAALGHV